MITLVLIWFNVTMCVLTWNQFNCKHGFTIYSLGYNPKLCVSITFSNFRSKTHKLIIVNFYVFSSNFIPTHCFVCILFHCGFLLFANELHFGLDVIHS